MVAFIPGECLLGWHRYWQSHLPFQNPHNSLIYYFDTGALSSCLAWNSFLPLLSSMLVHSHVGRMILHISPYSISVLT